TGINARNPQTTKITLARTPVAIGILTGLEHGLPRDSVATAACAVITFRLLENFLVACLRSHTALDFRHFAVPVAISNACNKRTVRPQSLLVELLVGHQPVHATLIGGMHHDLFGQPVLSLRRLLGQ